MASVNFSTPNCASAMPSSDSVAHFEKPKVLWTCRKYAWALSQFLSFSSLTPVS